MLDIAEKETYPRYEIVLQCRPQITCCRLCKKPKPWETLLTVTVHVFMKLYYLKVKMKTFILHTCATKNWMLEAKR